MERCRKLLLGVESGLEAIDDLGLVLLTGKDTHSTSANRNDGLLGIVGREVTTWAADPSSGSMGNELCGVVCRVPTNRSELFEVLLTSGNRDRKLIKEQKREVLPFR